MKPEPDFDKIVASIEIPDPDETESSWAFVDPNVTSGNQRVVPALLARSDGVRLLYPGAGHTLVGEPESLKSWVALLAAHQTCDDGGTVVWVDFEDGVDTFAERLETIDALEHFVTRRLAYVQPDEPMSTEAWSAFSSGLDAIKPSLVIFDGVTEGMTLSGLDPLSNKDAARFNQLLIKPTLDQSGAAVLSLDHVAKSKEQRGRWAIGAQHKLGVTTVSYGLRVIQQPAPGRDGFAVLSVAKDRRGEVRRHTEFGDQIGVVKFMSNPGGLLEIEIRPPQERTEFKPTYQMEQVSKYLETCDEPVSTNNVKAAVKGRDTYIQQALKDLVADGYVKPSDGKRGATLYVSIEPYRQNQEKNDG